MRLLVFAGILFIAAVWLAIDDAETSSGEEIASPQVTSSESFRTVTSRGGRSAPGAGRKREMDRLRASMRAFGEGELIEMLRDESPMSDREREMRVYAIWERLGELKSEKALEILLAVGTLTSPFSPDHSHLDRKFRNDVAYAFVGGWAASLDSLEEIKQELIPQLPKLKEAGIYQHEFALGREMARFEPVKSWEVLTALEDLGLLTHGQDFTLRGFVTAMEGNPSLSELIPLIQLRPVIGDDELLATSFSGGLVEIVGGQTTGVQFSPFMRGDEGIDVSVLEASYDPYVQSFNGFHLELTQYPQQPHLLSQALGVLMLSDPAEAARYLKEERDHPIEVQAARPNEVWKTMAKFDSNAAMALLQKPEFEEFKLGIGEGVVASSPQRVEEVMEKFSTPEEQETLLSSAISGRWEQDGPQFDPTNPWSLHGIDSEEVARVIGQSIDQSDVDESTRTELRSQLETQRVFLDLSGVGSPSFNAIIEGNKQ